jgi:hypothetical protein
MIVGTGRQAGRQGNVVRGECRYMGNLRERKDSGLEHGVFFRVEPRGCNTWLLLGCAMWHTCLHRFFAGAVIGLQILCRSAVCSVISISLSESESVQNSLG